MNMEGKPIDAIVTWVDGADPQHAAKRRSAMQTENIRALHYIPSGQGQQRYQNNDEVRYCIYSIRKFLPWIRTIFLITDSQRPKFLSDSLCSTLGLRIVDHSEIFQGHENILPTFNSITIETAIYRIKGLADRFIYFNDDFIAIEPSSTDDFFRDDKMVIRGEWRKLHNHGAVRSTISGIANRLYSLLGLRDRPMFLLHEVRAANLAGLGSRYVAIPHVPQAAIRSTLEAFFADRPELFIHNVKFRFRSMQQFGTLPLAAYLEVARGNYILNTSDDHLTVDFSLGKDVADALNKLLMGGHRFLCLQNFEKADVQSQKRIREFLEKRIMA